MGGVGKRDLKDWNITKELAMDRAAFSYPCARTMTWFRDLMGFNSSLPQLVWEKKASLLLLLLLLLIFEVTEFLRVIFGSGEKSVCCISFLSLQHRAFSVSYIAFRKETKSPQNKFYFENSHITINLIHLNRYSVLR